MLIHYRDCNPSINYMFKFNSLTYITATPFYSLSTFVLVIAVLKTERTVLTRHVEFDTWFSLNINNFYYFNYTDLCLTHHASRAARHTFAL